MGMGGINIGMTALQAQRQGLDTTGQNIANANTEGYSRQRVRLSALGSPTRPAFFSQFVSAGSGVKVDAIDRASDRFLQVRSLQEHALDSSLQQTKSILNRVELAFDEPSDEGLQNQLADFWSAWDDVANTPDDLATRTQLLEKARTVTAACPGGFTPGPCPGESGGPWARRLDARKPESVYQGASSGRYQGVSGSEESARSSLRLPAATTHVPFGSRYSPNRRSRSSE